MPPREWHLAWSTVPGGGCPTLTSSQSVVPLLLCSVWVMHAMLLLANAAGLAFVPHLRQLLDLAQGMLLSGAAWLGACGAGRQGLQGLCRCHRRLL